MQDCLYIGNLDALRDWGHAKDYVEMQWLMLQQDSPEDFVIATGEQHSVRSCIEIAARKIGIDITWQGEGVEEQGIDGDGRVIVRVDPRYFRPTEVDTLLGAAAKAKEKLGWEPRISFEALIEEMVTSDVRVAERDKIIEREGFRVLQHHE